MSEVCTACHRKLKDPESIARGMGPVCYQKFVGSPIRLTIKQLDPEQVPAVFTSKILPEDLPLIRLCRLLQDKFGG